MKPSFYLVTLLALLFVMTGCSDSLLSENEAVSEKATVEQTGPSKLRNAQFLEDAVVPGVAGKLSDGDGVAAFVGFAEYEADGVTPRILDQYAVTRRLLDEYGVTRRVLAEYGVTKRMLDQYGITRRVLDSYGVTNRILGQYGITAEAITQNGGLIDDALLARFGVSYSDLESQGVTRRMLDEYNTVAEYLLTQGVTRRMIDQYEGDVATRVLLGKAQKGVAVVISQPVFDAIVEEAADDADIAFIEPDPTFFTPIVMQTQRSGSDAQLVPWGIDFIGARVADFTTGGIHIYVLDSGVNDHDLQVIERKDFTMLFTDRTRDYVDDSEIRDIGYFDPGTAGNPNDENGHGTHVAGTAAGIDNMLGIHGVASNIKIHSLKVLTAEGRTDVTTVVAALNYVIAAQERYIAEGAPDRIVVNLSFGMDSGTTAYNLLDETVQRAIDLGIVVVASAGNAGTDAATYSPAHVADAITVGAHDREGRMASFSNYGGGVDLFAPGVDIVSLPWLPEDIASGALMINSGTSMAAPHVAGAAAIYLALNKTANPNEVAGKLRFHAKKGLLDKPAGTADLMLDVEAFARNWRKDRNLRITSASWDAAKKQLVMHGNAPRLEYVRFEYKNGNAFGAPVQSDHQRSMWNETVLQPSVVPCNVYAFWTDRNGREVKAWRKVDYAPRGCK